MKGILKRNTQKRKIFGLKQFDKKKIKKEKLILNEKILLFMEMKYKSPN